MSMAEWPAEILGTRGMDWDPEADEAWRADAVDRVRLIQFMEACMAVDVMTSEGEYRLLSPLTDWCAAWVHEWWHSDPDTPCGLNEQCVN